MGKAEYKVEGGKLIRVQLRKRDGRIEEIKITGDFFLHPERFIEELEEALLGRDLDEKDLTAYIETLVEKGKVTFLGASPEDFARCIIMAGEQDG
jgi:lipoate-protein ligase A